MQHAARAPRSAPPGPALRATPASRGGAVSAYSGAGGATGRTSSRSGQVHLNAFLKPPGEYLAAWRLPDAVAGAGVDIRHVASLVQRAEAALFDAVFLA